MERVVRRLFAVLLIGLLAGSLAACYTLLKHPSTEAGDDSNADPCVDCPSYYASPYVLWPALPLIGPLPLPPPGGRDREAQSGPPARAINPKEPTDKKTPSKESTGTGDPKEKRRN